MWSHRYPPTRSWILQHFISCFHLSISIRSLQTDEIPSIQTHCDIYRTDLSGTLDLFISWPEQFWWKKKGSSIRYFLVLILFTTGSSEITHECTSKRQSNGEGWCSASTKGRSLIVSINLFFSSLSLPLSLSFFQPHRFHYSCHLLFSFADSSRDMNEMKYLSFHLSLSFSIQHLIDMPIFRGKSSYWQSPLIGRRSSTDLIELIHEHPSLLIKDSPEWWRYINDRLIACMCRWSLRVL